MARPNKTGLDYFPLDIDFFDDEKIVAISGEFGIKGEIVAIKLLCAIYRNGYFILWNDLFKFKLLKNLPGVSPELFDSILNRLVLWGFFDKGLFDSMGVLTSVGIQKRYFKISKRRKSVDDFRYLLIEVSGCENREVFSSDDGDLSSDTVNVYNNGVNVSNNSFSADINVRNNITKKRKGKKDITPTPPIQGEPPENKRAPRKKKEPKSIHSKARIIFEEYFSEVFGESYYWSAKDAGSMKQILQKIEFNRSQKQPPLPNDEKEVLNALVMLLQSITDGWLYEHFSVTNINSQFNEIVSQAKKKAHGKTDRRADKEAKAKRIVEKYIALNIGSCEDKDTGEIPEL